MDGDYFDRAAIRSGTAVDGHLQGCAELAHASVGEAPESVDENTHRNALHGVEIDGRRPGHGIFAGLQEYLAWQSPDRRGAGCHDGTSQSGDGSVAREDHDRPATDARQFAPPNLSTGGNGIHEAEAASRNEARSPHSSGSSSGCSS